MGSRGELLAVLNFIRMCDAEPKWAEATSGAGHQAYLLNGSVGMAVLPLDVRRHHQLCVGDDIADMSVVVDEAGQTVVPFEPHHGAGLRIGAVIEDCDHLLAPSGPVSQAGASHTLSLLA
jgi:hypothetical protein